MNPDHDTLSAPVNDAAAKMEALVCRVRGEFLEMPGLRLTEAQARRLWTVDAATCAAVLERLIAAGFLFCTRDGAFMRVEYAQHGTGRLASAGPGRSAA
jgi:hypothetical protein